MRKRSPETEVRYLRVALSNACVALGLVAEPHTRQQWQTEDFVRRLAGDVLHNAREVMRKPRRASRRDGREG